MIKTKSDGNGLFTISLDRVEKANALTSEMIATLIEAVEQALAQDARAIVLTGNGKVFSAGADLDEARAGLATSPLWERLSGAIAKAPALTIAALNGTAAGGALGMVLACDIRIGVPGTKFFYPVMKLGFLPQPSDPQRLRALVGPSHAAMILMTGHRVETDEALAWGLLDRVVPADELMATADLLAKDVLTANANHVAGIKRMIYPAK